MQLREGEAERQAYLARRMNAADMATREYVNRHAYDIGFEEGLAKAHSMRIHFAQRVLGQPLTPVDHLKWWPLSELTFLADQLEQQFLSPKDAP